MNIKTQFRNRNDLKDKSDLEVKKFADEGDFVAIFEYGMRLYSESNYEESFKYLYSIKDADNFFIWERLVDLNDYLKDKMSDEEVFELLVKIHSKVANAYSYQLAECYEKGIGCKKDLDKYIEILTKCANDGSSYATIELAENYEKGYGVEKSLQKAYELYSNYVDDHFRKDYWCAYKTALYMLNEWGGATKDMNSIKYNLEYASKVHKEARELYKQLFNEDPK